MLLFALCRGVVLAPSMRGLAQRELWLGECTIIRTTLPQSRLTPWQPPQRGGQEYALSKLLSSNSVRRSFDFVALRSGWHTFFGGQVFGPSRTPVPTVFYYFIIENHTVIKRNKEETISRVEIPPGNKCLISYLLFLIYSFCVSGFK